MHYYFCFLVTVTLKNEYLNLKPFARLSGLCGTHNNPWLFLEFANLSKDPISAVVKADFLFQEAFIRLNIWVMGSESKPLIYEWIFIWNHFSLLNSAKRGMECFLFNAYIQHVAKKLDGIQPGGLKSLRKISSSQVFVQPWYSK